MSNARATSKAATAGSSTKKIAASPSRSRVSKNNDPTSSSHSRLVGASSKIAGSSMHAGGGGGNQATQVYLDGMNVTPQSLLFTRTKGSDKSAAAASGRERAKAAKKTPDNTSGVSMMASSTSSVFSESEGGSSAGGDSGKSLDAILSGVPSMKVLAGPVASAKKTEASDDGDGDGLVGIDDSGHLDATTSTAGLRPKSELDGRPGITGRGETKAVQGPVTIRFTETPTMMLFEWHSICVGQDTPDHGIVVAKNRKYLEMCGSKRGSDSYVENRTQTLQLAQKTKEVMTAPPATRDAASSATDWDIFDSTQADIDMSGNDHDDAALDTTPNKSKAAVDAENVDVQLTKQVDEIVSASLASPGCLLLTDGAELLGDLKARQRALQPSSRHKPTATSSSHHHVGASASTSSTSTIGGGESSANVNGSAANNNQPSSSQSDVTSGDIISGSHADISRSSANSDGSNSADGKGANNAYAAANTNVDLADIIAEQKTQEVLASTGLLKTLQVLERAVQQNFYHDRHLLYRNFPRLSSGASQPTRLGAGGNSLSSSMVNVFDKSNELEKLWGFSCALTAGRTAWNPVNDDLLAVSYGQFDADAAESDGLVLFWSLKNPEYPERVYKLGCGVTSIDFSRLHPNLLAVGFHNGIVALFDTRKDDAAPILSSDSHSGSHLDVVWQVKWVHKGSERGESIVSVSSDGRVTEWSMKKGLSFSDLMTLKRVPNPLMGSEARIDGVIARQASGNCIEFAQNDSSVYFVGTEDGNIHKCSCSYNEQYLETYYGHTAAVYAIHMSPFWNQLLLSCSADWTVKLWHEADQHEVLNFRSVDLCHGVYGVAWCPNDATIFGSVTEDGRIEIWDLEQSVLDPIVTHFPKEDVHCTCISFAPSSPVLVVGDSTGEVGVYRVPTLAEGRCVGQSIEDQIERLKRAVRPHQGE
ncbi:hypothetical protein B5M09_011639 [Aphanomyces astaci]|uniref:Dynein axonemal intermediate chain 4 n=1 Tax=Aphanomyces astaci TaxID=112090 RepID=A0A3R7YFX6_APHAT|nr:hypothetical protein B5M09_011639 [Aphanomyces astaci]